MVRSSYSSRINNCRGVSYAELLVVVALAGLMIALAASAFSNLLAQYRLTVSSNALMSAFMMARQSAITQNQVVALCAGNPESGCHSDWGSGEWLIFTDRNQNGARDADDTLIQSGSAAQGSGIQILPNRPMQKPVLFQPIGHAEQPRGAFAAGTLRLCSNTLNTVLGVDLILSKSGNIRAQPHDSAGNCARP